MDNKCIFYCKICNKSYLNSNSFGNHRRKFHNNIDQKYSCNYCNKKFNNYQNRWKHEKICKKQNNNIITNNINTINSHNMTNSHNNINNDNRINNNFNLNVTFKINSCGDEKISDLSLDEVKEILLSCGEFKESMTKFIELVNFNERLPENHSFCMTDLKSKYVSSYDNATKKIKKNRKTYHFDQLFNNAAKQIKKIYDNNKNKIPD